MSRRAVAIFSVVLLATSCVASPVIAAGDPPSIETAIAFTDADGQFVQDHTFVEVRFDRAINASSLAPQDVVVTVDNGSTVAPAAIREGAKTDDAQILLDMGKKSGVSTTSITEVGIADDSSFNTTDGKTHTGSGLTNETVTPTTTTLTEGAKGVDRNALRGERVAIVGDSAGERLEIQTADGRLHRQVYLSDDGQIFALNTTSLEGSHYTVLFDGNRSIHPGDDHRVLELWNLSMGLQVNANPNVDDATIITEENLTGQVTTNAAGYGVTVLVQDGDETIRSTRTTTDGSGDVSFDFAPIQLDEADDHFQVIARHDATGSTAVERIKVSRVANEAVFGTEVVSDTRGDVLEIPIRLSPTLNDRVAADYATVVVGSNESGYRAVVTVFDGNNDQEITLEWNTYAADGPGGEAEFSVAETEKDERDDTYTVESISTSVSGPPTEVLDPAFYLVDVRAGENAGERPADAVLGASLTDTATPSIGVRTAPTSLDYESADDLRRGSTPTSAVVEDQYAIVSLERSGLFGYFKTQNDLATPLVDSDESEVAGDGIELTIEEANPTQNRDLRRLSSGDVHDVLTDQSNDTVYLVVDTSTVDHMSTGERYRAHWRLDEDHGLIESNGTTGEVVNETASQTFSLTSPDATIDDGGDGDYYLANGSQANLIGSTNLAAGTEIRVTLESPDDGRMRNGIVTVDESGNFETSFDLSAFTAQTNFTAEVAYDGRRISDRVEGKIVAPNTRETATRPPTMSSSTTALTTAGAITEQSKRSLASPTLSSSDVRTSSQPSVEQQRTRGGETPGFGMVVMVLSLSGVAFLALRRKRL